MWPKFARDPPIDPWQVHTERDPPIDPWQVHTERDPPIDPWQVHTERDPPIDPWQVHTERDPPIDAWQVHTERDPPIDPWQVHTERLSFKNCFFTFSYWFWWILRAFLFFLFCFLSDLFFFFFLQNFVIEWAVKTDTVVLQIFGALKFRWRAITEHSVKSPQTPTWSLIVHANYFSPFGVVLNSVRLLAQGWKIFSVILAKVDVNVSFSCQSGSIAEISVAKSTNAKKCTTGVFLKWLLFDGLSKP